MPDSGRELYKSVRAEERILSARVDGEPVTSDAGLTESIQLLKGKNLGVVGSCKSSLEEQFLLNLIAKGTNSKKFIRGHFGEDDGILLSADRTPNLRGALVSGFTSTYPKEDLSAISQTISRKQVDALLVIGEDLPDSKV